MYQGAGSLLFFSLRLKEKVKKNATEKKGTSKKNEGTCVKRHKIDTEEDKIEK